MNIKLFIFGEQFILLETPAGHLETVITLYANIANEAEKLVQLPQVNIDFTLQDTKGTPFTIDTKNNHNLFEIVLNELFLTISKYYVTNVKEIC